MIQLNNARNTQEAIKRAKNSIEEDKINKLADKIKEKTLALDEARAIVANLEKELDELCN